MRFWLLPFLLAITLGCVSEAHSSAQAFADDGFIGLSAQRHHCCRIEADNTDRYRAGSENQLPCTCRSQYNEKLRTAVSPDSLRWHPDNGSSVLQQSTLSTHTQVAMRTIGSFPVDPTPIYPLIARLLI
jgi:hypothetical protein